MTDSVIDVHNGIRFKVEAVTKGELFVGRFTILDPTSAAVSAADDSYRPTIDNAWATPAEALTYATEAAHHAIERIPPFT
jgi:hypothetical protein